MQIATATEPLQTLTIPGRLLQVCRVDVFPDRVVVERRRRGGTPRRTTIELVDGLGAVVGEDWLLVGRPGALRRTTYSVEYGGRLVVSGVRSCPDADRIARAVNSVCRPDAD